MHGVRREDAWYGDRRFSQEVVMKVGDVMTRELVSVGPDTPFKEVVERLVRADVSSLPVVGPDGRLLGLITEADLISKEAYGPHRRRALALLADLVSARDHHWLVKAAGSLAADVMTTDVMVCSPDDELRVAAKRMLERGVKRMPVVDAGVLVGIVSRKDILGSLDRPDTAIAGDVDRVLSDGLNMPEGAHVRYLVEQGVVTLGGDVRYQWDDPIVVSLVREVPGVIEVVDHLHHRHANPRPSTQQWMFGAR
jgi:CBS domain-containing protein